MELGRKKVACANRRVYENPGEPVAPPESAADVRQLLAEAMAELKAGRMDPKVAILEMAPANPASSL